MAAIPQLRVLAVPGLPMVRAGDDLAATTWQHARAAGLELLEGDVVVFAQKIVSKAEGRRVELATVTPSAAALELAALVCKDPRLVELVLRESRRVVRSAPDVLIVEHRLGFIMANAGIDQSNVAGSSEPECALLLPIDPDASAERLRDGLMKLSGVRIGVIVSDSFGRPWRLGTVGVALGAAGVAALLDLRGAPDLFGRTLRVTTVGHADEIAAAASLLMGQGNEGRPVAIVRGIAPAMAATPASALLRTQGEDLFR